MILSFIDIVLLALLLITGCGVILARNLLTSTIILSVFSLLMAILYLILKAPDVAMTEAAVGAGISTLLFLATLFLIGAKEKKSAHPVLPLVVIGLTSFALIYATLGMPAFGDANAPANLHVAQYYIQHSSLETGIPNIVTSVLASYRGFDTLGEVMVIFTAGIAVLLLLGNKRKGL